MDKKLDAEKTKVQSQRSESLRSLQVTPFCPGSGDVVTCRALSASSTSLVQECRNYFPCHQVQATNEASPLFEESSKAIISSKFLEIELEYSMNTLV